jgi:hypothetical protein
MHERWVHGVVVVLQHELPVPLIRVPEHAAGHLDLARGRALHEVVERLAQRPQELEEWRADWAQRGEDEAPIDVDPRRARESTLRGSDDRTRVAFGQREAAEASVGVVGPAVIGAHELARGAGRDLAHLGAAMGAPVDQHAHRAVGVPRHDDRLAAHPRGEEIARVPDLALVAEHQPRAAEDPVEL